MALISGDGVEKGPHVSRYISLEVFTPHFSPVGDTVRGNDSVLEPEYYTYGCRCGGQFVITMADLEVGVEVVGCEGCGEWIRVGYELATANEVLNPVETSSQQDPDAPRYA